MISPRLTWPVDSLCRLLWAAGSELPRSARHTGIHQSFWIVSDEDKPPSLNITAGKPCMPCWTQLWRVMWFGSHWTRPTCIFSCVSSSNSLSASASECSLSCRGTGEPGQASCSSQPCWELPSAGFTEVGCSCWTTKAIKHVLNGSYCTRPTPWRIYRLLCQLT